MNNTIIFEQRVSKRSRSLRITIEKTGRVILTRPVFVPERRALLFLQEREAWVRKHLENYKKYTAIIPAYTQNDVASLKGELLEKVMERVRHFNQIYRLHYAKVSIRDTKTRWGSCSKKGNLQFSFKMNYLPSHLFDYIIVHELCHLQAFNHSQEFWNLVAVTLPQWKALRSELRKVV